MTSSTYLLMDYFYLFLLGVALGLASGASHRGTYSAAKSRCDSKSARLASEEEIKQLGIRDVPEIWLPYQKVLTKWRWINGTLLGKEVVQKSASVPDQDCAVIRSADAILDESYCFSKRYEFLCSHRGPCPRCRKIGNEHISVHYERQTWFEAEKTCRDRHGGRLAVFANSVINEVVNSVKRHLDKPGHFWIGLTRIKWTSDRGLTPNDFRWTQQSSDSGKCAVVLANSNWQTKNCNTTALYYCSGEDGEETTSVISRKGSFFTKLSDIRTTVTSPNENPNYILQATPSNKAKGSKAGIVAAILIPLFVIVCLAVLVFFFICRKKKRSTSSKNEKGEKEMQRMLDHQSEIPHRANENQNTGSTYVPYNNNVRLAKDHEDRKNLIEEQPSKKIQEEGINSTNGLPENSQLEETDYDSSEAVSALKEFLEKNENRSLEKFEILFQREPTPFLEKLDLIMQKFPPLQERECLCFSKFLSAVIAEYPEQITDQHVDMIIDKFSKLKEEAHCLTSIKQIVKLNGQLVQERHCDPFLQGLRPHGEDNTLINTDDAIEILNHFATLRSLSQNCSEECGLFIVQHCEKISKEYNEKYLNLLRKFQSKAEGAAEEENMDISPKLLAEAQGKLDNAINQGKETVNFTEEEVNGLDSILSLRKVFPDILGTKQIKSVIVFWNKKDQKGKQVMYLILDIVSKENPKLLSMYKDEIATGILKDDDAYLPGRVEIATRVAQFDEALASKLLKKFVNYVGNSKSPSDTATSSLLNRILDLVKYKIETSKLDDLDKLKNDFDKLKNFQHHEHHSDIITNILSTLSQESSNGAGENSRREDDIKTKD